MYRDTYYSSDDYRKRLERLSNAIKNRDAARALAEARKQDKLEMVHPTLRPWRKGDPIVELKPANPLEGCEEYRPIPKLDSPNLSDVRTPQAMDSKNASSFEGVVFSGRKTPRRAGSDEAFGSSGNAFNKNPFATDRRPRALRFE